MMEYWNESWKPVYFPGITGEIKYEISNYGRLRRFRKDLDTWVILKPARSNGYFCYSFNGDQGRKNRKTKTLHKLVAEMFCKKVSDEHRYVIHKDYNKQNNYYENLSWVTQDQLNIHFKNNPKIKEALKKRERTITNSKLTETQVIRLKLKLKRGKNPLYKIAKEFGITHTQLNRIRSGENWGHVKVD